MGCPELSQVLKDRGVVEAVDVAVAQGADEQATVAVGGRERAHGLHLLLDQRRGHLRSGPDS